MITCLFYIKNGHSDRFLFFVTGHQLIKRTKTGFNVTKVIVPEVNMYQLSLK
jgi:hypothetical protein